MRTFEFVVLGVVAVAFVLGWVLRRFGSIWGGRLPLYAGIFVRFASGLIVARIAVRAAAVGGYWIAAAIGLGVFALVTFAYAGFLAWGVIKFRSEIEN